MSQAVTSRASAARESGDSLAVRKALLVPDEHSSASGFRARIERLLTPRSLLPKTAVTGRLRPYNPAAPVSGRGSSPVYRGQYEALAGQPSARGRFVTITA